MIVIMRVIIPNIYQNYAAWIEQKRTSIGSGDIASIIGCGYQSPLSLWAIKTGKEPAPLSNDYMWWGTMMEGPIAHLCGRKLNMQVRHANTLFGHDTLDWATATPDYFGWPIDVVGDADFSTFAPNEFPIEPHLIECKNVSWRSSQNWGEDVPLSVKAQLIWQMGVTGYKQGVIAPLVGGEISTFAPTKIDFESKIFDQLVFLAEKFLWNIKNDVPPVATAADTQLVTALIGKLEDAPISLDQDVDALLLSREYLKVAEDIRAVKQTLDPLEERHKALQNQLRQAMGSASSAKAGDYLITCKEIEVPERLNKAYSYVRFNIKEKKN